MSNTTNLSAVYVDLGTFNDLTTEFYHGEDAALRFTQCVDQWAWFSQAPHDLTVCNTGSFGREARFELSNVPVYVTSTWMRFVTPAVTVQGHTNRANNTVGTVAGAQFFGAWTRNLGHWIASSIELEINSVAIQTITPPYLDFFSQLCVPAGKRIIYDNMIGNVNELIDPYSAGSLGGIGAAAADYDHTIAARVINVPIPFFFCGDDGKALPRAAMHLSRVMVKARFADFDNVFHLYENNDPAAGGIVAGGGVPLRLSALANVAAVPELSSVQMFCNAILTTSDERTLIANCQRKQSVRLIQEQTPVSTTAGIATIQVDLDFAHHVSHIFFALRNRTYSGIRANYTTASPVAENDPVYRINFDPTDSVDPIAQARLQYDSISRMDMQADFYSLVQPYYHADNGPEETGYHMYSYSRHIRSEGPVGSTDFTQLNRPKLVLTTSANYQTFSAAAGTAAGGTHRIQEFEVVCYAEYWTLITSGMGQFGFTVA